MIKSGNFDLVSLTLTLLYHQSLNNEDGRAVFTLSQDGKKLDGTYRNASGGNDPSILTRR